MRRCLMIGAGGMAGAWLRGFFPNFAERMQVVGLVDVRRRVHGLGQFVSARLTS